jgi:large subunit ribosomal protein L9
MKVILLRDIPKVGKKYEVKVVSDGYAMNFLLRQGFAEEASTKKISALSHIKARTESVDKLQGDLLQKSLDSLGKQTVVIHAKANEQGHLFQGIHSKDIVEAIEKEAGVRLLPDAIILEHPLKEVGEYPMSIVVGDMKATVSISVVSEV